MAGNYVTKHTFSRRSSVISMKTILQCSYPSRSESSASISSMGSRSSITGGMDSSSSAFRDALSYSLKHWMLYLHFNSTLLFEKLAQHILHALFGDGIEFGSCENFNLKIIRTESNRNESSQSIGDLGVWTCNGKLGIFFSVVDLNYWWMDENK